MLKTLASLSVLFSLLCGFLALPLTSAAQAGFHGGGSQAINYSSPLGVNAGEFGLTPISTEHAFLNQIHEGGGWYTIESNGSTDAGAEAYLYSNCLDSNGYFIGTQGSCNPSSPSSGNPFTSVSTQVMTGQTYYAGTWVFLWDGDNAATFTFSKDLSGATSCPISGYPNRIISTSSAAGVGLSFLETSPGATGNYAHNFRLVYSPDSTCGAAGTRETSMLNQAGALAPGGLNPDYQSRYQYFKTWRFLNWSSVFITTQSSLWSNRPPINWVFWNENTHSTAQASGSPYYGAPWEAAIYVANTLGCDLWLNINVLLTNDTYLNNLAALVLADLNAPLRVIPEYANEVWNSASPVYGMNDTLAKATFGGATGLGGGTLGNYSMQAAMQAHIGYLFKNVFGSQSSRVRNPIGVQTVLDTGYGSGECCNSINDILFTTPLWTGTGTPLVYTASIDNCTPSCGSGSSGNKLDVTAVTSGTIVVGSPVIISNGNYYGTVTALGASGCTPAGTGGTGCYTISTSQVYASGFVLGGGGPSPGGLAYQYYDEVETAPYWGYDPPPSWTSSGDGGLTQLFTELESGGLQPTGAGACTTAGTSPAYTVSSNVGSCGSSGSVTCPPADQTILPVIFNQASGSNPTLAVDGCATAYPIQNPPGTNTTVSNGQEINVTYMASQSAWVLAPLGETGGGLAYKSTVEQAWITKGNTYSLPVGCYEFGPNYTSNTATFTLLNNAQTDSRMGTAVANALANIKTNGYHNCNYYDGADATAGSNGFWGMITNITQTTSGHPKFQALINFINSNPCWWSGCNGGWLFKRDIDPASNDNSPAFMDKAA